LRDLFSAYPEAHRSLRELRFSIGDGEAFLYPFGAAVFRNVPAEAREREIARLRRALPKLTARVIREEFSVLEATGEHPGVSEGTLLVDRLSSERSGIVALTVAQSAAMEYYESLVDQMFVRTGVIVGRLERKGTVSMRTRPLHRFIGEAVATRAEVFTVLSLLDKPDETWEDAAMDRIYAELRSEFDLGDRYTSLELKLRSVQESLELVLDVARDRRLVLLEIAIVLLVALELVLPLLHFF
jgi:uncharacterized Rmd1/YagE family protein